METPPVQTLPGQPPAQQKNNNTKIIIIVLAVVAVVCLIGCGAIALITGKIGSSIAQNVQLEPADVSASAEKVADFDLPAGFEPKTSMSILGMTFLMYEAPEKDSAMVIVQMPSSMEMTDEAIQQMKEQMERQSNRQLENFEIVDEYDTTIRGEPGKVIIQEGQSNGQDFRQMLVVFQGKGGLSMASIFGPKASWDQDEYDNFIQSIK